MLVFQPEAIYCTCIGYLDFHTSANYQIQAPPYEDLKADSARINQTRYATEIDLHLDFYPAFKRVNDGHCGVYNYCYDGLVYVTYLPLALVFLTDKNGYQNVYIAPEAFSIASAEFKDEIEFWQNALPDHLRGQLNTYCLSGARVYLIDGEEPALKTGGYQAFGTRQNAFFASYQRGANDWSYLMGNFAAMAHPLVDSVELTVQRVNYDSNDTFTMPYRSRFGSSSKNFTDLVSYRENNCRVAQNTTNGVDLYGPDALSQYETIPNPIAHFQQQPGTNPLDARKQRVNVILDAVPLSDIELPRELQPSLAPLNKSYGVAHFYMLSGSSTGVLALGSFSAANFTKFGSCLLDGLTSLKELGAKNLIVDATNNGGGYICIAHVRTPRLGDYGLDTTLRTGPLANLLVEKISQGVDPQKLSLYNPLQWRNAAHVTFPANSEWLNPQNINGQECQPFDWQPPNDTLFEPHNVVIISNGRRASSCSLFSFSFALDLGVRTVVVGGKQDVTQHHCGTVGGQSTDFSTIDTEVKTLKLKITPLHHLTCALGDNCTFTLLMRLSSSSLTNSVQGITWRLGYGIHRRDQPGEWQDHTADFNFPLTKEM
ncbi:hypothetical protein M378DRAFT_186093 [Amanita muscaria Koide BX008]|uniref:Tail specific protease domain-containing protein n=1 Tax=Amanita muscaria (strain Koide BX008) TaxID=946122 RepID=A0A0C2WWV1_AMAMK|nr:hypothetical protein M378DRAFT_186093 [Amanita muscaria Koide BX008]